MTPITKPKAHDNPEATMSRKVADTLPTRPPSANKPALSAREQVVLEFQRTTLEIASRFLEAQQRVMLAYLDQNQHWQDVKHTAADLVLSTATRQPVPELGGGDELSTSTPLSAYSAQPLSAHSAGQSVEVETPAIPSLYSPAPVGEVARANNGDRRSSPSPAKPASPEGTFSRQAEFDAESLITSLIEIVSDRTGYPAEMLDPDLDLEADLGIDSIKRVEILNSFRRLLPENSRNVLEDGIEKLAGLKTLRGIMDWIRGDLQLLVLGSEQSQEATHVGVATQSSQASVSVADQAHDKSFSSEAFTLGGAGGGITGTTNSSITARGARLHSAAVRDIPHGAEFEITLDRRFDLYLNDHTFDDIPVMPMAMCVELMAEAALSLHPGWRLAGLIDMEIPAGIVIESMTKNIIVTAETLSVEYSLITVKLCVSTMSGAKRLHFKAVGELTPHLLSYQRINSALPALFAVPPLQDPRPSPNREEIYSNIMFHGPAFQGIDAIIGLGSNAIAGRLTAQPSDKLLRTNNGHAWIIDPALLDSAMQLAGVWARQYLDITVLPAGFKALRLLSSVAGTDFTGFVAIPPETAGLELSCDLAIYSSDGNIVLTIEGLKGIGTRSLNRLASKKS